MSAAPELHGAARAGSWPRRTGPPRGTAHAAAPGWAGDRDRDLRGPARNVLLLHAYPRLSPPVVRLDEAFRDDARGGVPVSRLLLHRVSGPHALRRRRAPARAAHAPPPEVRVTRHRPDRRRRKPRAPRRAAEPRGSVLGGSGRVPQRGPVQRHRPPAERRRHRHLAAPELDGNPGARAAPPAGDPPRDRDLGIGALRTWPGRRPPACSSRPSPAASRSATSRARRIQQIIDAGRARCRRTRSS